jgi:hypothetical protein
MIQIIERPLKTLYPFSIRFIEQLRHALPVAGIKKEVI